MKYLRISRLFLLFLAYRLVTQMAALYELRYASPNSAQMARHRAFESRRSMGGDDASIPELEAACEGLCELRHMA